MPAFGYKRALGFTLIELMIAVTIVAILAAVAIPSYKNYIDRSELRGAQADAVALSLAMENRYQRTLSYPGGNSQTYVQSSTKTEITDLLPSWTPSADLGEFSYSVTSGSQVDIDNVTQPGYIIEISSSSTKCKVYLNSKNKREIKSTTTGGGCKLGNEWL